MFFLVILCLLCSLLVFVVCAGWAWLTWFSNHSAIEPHVFDSYSSNSLVHQDPAVSNSALLSHTPLFVIFSSVVTILCQSNSFGKPLKIFWIPVSWLFTSFFLPSPACYAQPSLVCSLALIDLPEDSSRLLQHCLCFIHLNNKSHTCHGCQCGYYVRTSTRLTGKVWGG